MRIFLLGGLMGYFFMKSSLSVGDKTEDATSVYRDFKMFQQHLHMPISHL